MARREFNIFSISFLDLLSGALGALIILFLIMPKMAQQQQQTVEVLDSLNVQVNQISEMIERMENSVDRAVAQQLQQELERVRQSAREVQQQMESQQRENQRLQEQNRALNEQVRQASAARGGGGRGAEMFGVNAEFAVVSKWEEVELDVDLYMIDRSTGKSCHYQSTDPGFAKYLADVQRRERRDENLYEMIYQPTIKPGTYDVYIHLYSSSGTARVNTYAVLYPFTPREKKIALPEKAIQHNSKPPQGGYKLGTLTVSSNNISIQ